MGPNGSGKSTLAHVLMGRGDYEVTGGSVTLDGEELLDLPTHGSAPRTACSSRCSTRWRSRACASTTSSTPRFHGQGRDGRRPECRASPREAERLGVAAAVPRPRRERRVLRRRAEAGRDAAARGAAPEVRGARRDRLRPRRRRAARRRPPHRGDDDRGRPRRARDHPLRPPARRAPPRRGPRPHGRAGRADRRARAGRRARGDRLRRSRRRARRGDRRSKSTPSRATPSPTRWGSDAARASDSAVR